MNKLDKLLVESEDLEFMDKKFTILIDQLEADCALIKQTMEKAASWKSGQGKESFLDAMEKYFHTYSLKLSKMRDLSNDINRARKNIKADIHDELILPKW
ncbi:hypothetical protein [Bacillus sp. CECT 9360]|uniref:hypothetical protein n=1 Tax=Bacillus sp. CECT 9360 TaxID=2845821 RepID=UPI001E2E0B63|nr:hypothetical protein [Bacillus sp. CECT 9360]CAH0343892.1 hypothetical protein BCI9360_00119 [Bacillus sp. CECT 9360]